MKNSKEKTEIVGKFFAVLGLVKLLKENKRAIESGEEKSLDQESGFAAKLFTKIGMIKPTRDIESQREVRVEISNQNRKMGFWGKLFSILGLVKPPA